MWRIWGERLKNVTWSRRDEGATGRSGWGRAGSEAAQMDVERAGSESAMSRLNPVLSASRKMELNRRKTDLANYGNIKHKSDWSSEHLWRMICSAAKIKIAA